MVNQLLYNKGPHQDGLAGQSHGVPQTHPSMVTHIDPQAGGISQTHCLSLRSEGSVPTSPWDLNWRDRSQDA